MSEITKRCVCGRPMVERTNSKNGSTFLACTGWTERDDRDQPLCSETAPLPASVVMQRAGAALLPGLE